MNTDSKTILTLLFSKILVDIIYYTISVNIYSYQGYTADLNLYFLNFPVSLLFLIPFLLNNKNNNISNFLISILLIGILLPLSSMFTFGYAPFSWFIINIFSFLFIILMNNFLSNIKLEVPSFSNWSVFNLIFYSFYFFSFIFFIRQYGFNMISLDNFSLISNSIYSNRSAFNYSNPNYLMINLFTIGAPLLFAYSVVYKKRLLTIASFFLAIIIFSTSSEKSLLFSMALYAGVIVINWIIKLPQQVDLIRGYIFMIGCASVNYFISPILSSLFLNRLIFTPQIVSLYYYQYFQEYGYTYFLDTSVFSAIFGKSYHTNVAKEVGRIFFDNQTSANTGLISDGYSKFGIIGVIVVCTLFILILKIVDSFSKNKNQLFIKLIMTYSVFTMINSSIFTVFLSSGLFLSIILIVAIPINDYKINTLHTNTTHE